MRFQHQAKCKFTCIAIGITLFSEAWRTVLIIHHMHQILWIYLQFSGKTDGEMCWLHFPIHKYVPKSVEQSSTYCHFMNCNLQWELTGAKKKINVLSPGACGFKKQQEAIKGVTCLRMQHSQKYRVSKIKTRWLIRRKKMKIIFLALNFSREILGN